MKLTIYGREYELRNTIRACFIMEQITGKPFAIENMLDQYVFMFSMILANNPDCTLDFNRFVDFIDENPKAMEEFLNYLVEYRRSREVIGSDEPDAEDADGKKKAN